MFGVLSVGRAANGWMGSTPFQVTTTILTATIGIVVGVFAYVGGITVFEHFVVDVVPYDVPAAVGPLWVAATLFGIAIVVAVITLTPGPRGQDLRRRVYVWLVSTGAATPRPVRRSHRSRSPFAEAGERGPHRGRNARHRRRPLMTTITRSAPPNPHDC